MDRIREKLDLNLNGGERESLMQHIPETQELADDILDSIASDSSSAMTETITQSGKMSSKKYNEFFHNVFLDLYTLYQKSQKINDSIENNIEIDDETINKIKHQIKNIKEKADKYKTLVHNDEGFTRAYYDYFNNRDKFEEYGNDRTVFNHPKRDIILPEKQLATIEPAIGLTASRSGVITPNTMYASVVKQTGKNLIPYPDDVNNINNIFDTRDNYVWKETILADEPFNVPFNDIMYYGETKGAFCKIRIIIPSTSLVNYISLIPHSDTPFEILSIFSYKTLGSMYIANEEEQDLKEIKDNDNIDIILSPESEGLDSFTLTDSKKLTFDNIEDCKAIEIAIKQDNYKLTRYSNLLEDKQKIDMMNDLFKDGEIDIDIRTAEVDSVPELDYKNRNKTWNRFSSVFKNIFKNINNIDGDKITDTLVNAISYLLPGISKYQLNKLVNNKEGDTTSSTKKTITQKYLYEYGLKEIDIGYQDIANESIYVSKPYEIDTNVKEVGLSSKEYIPTEDNNKSGYIEYYVTNSLEPSEDEWYPILPEEKEKHIDIEPVVIDIDESRTGNLTFPAKRNSLNIYSDYKKEEKVEINEITKNDEKVTTGFIIPDDEEVEYKRYLYAEYDIHDNNDPYIVDFDSVSSPSPYIGDDGKEGEVFEDGTDKNGMIILSFFPYIDYDNVNSLNSIVDPDIIISNEEVNIDEKYVIHNQSIHNYNPNYRRGYRPINVTMEGSYQSYNTEEEETNNVEGTITNDTLGLRYNTSFYNPEKEETVELNRFEDEVEYTPYFYNRTNYVKRENPALTEFDPIDYPVFEYIQDGRHVFFNDTLHKHGSGNRGKLRIRYDYLVEGLRIKILIYNFTDSNLTPVVENYFIKSRDFQYIPGGFR